MRYGMAIDIIEHLEEHTDEEIALAIHTILNMATIMAVKKDSLLGVVRYLFDKCYEVKEIRTNEISNDKHTTPMV